MAPKILVVDDNQELLSLLTQLFEEAGYSVLAANKGKTALDAARQNPDLKLALLDVLLPDMMGFALAESLRKEISGLPLVFITGVFKGGRHALDARNKYQAVGYFEKPFEAQKLLEAVGNVVPPEKQAPPQSIEDAFEVELDIDVEEDAPVDAMELTGKIKVTGGDGGLTAEIKGQNLTMGAVQKGQAGPARPPPPNQPVAPVPQSHKQDPKSRRGELTDNLPSLITAFWLSKETGELGIQRGKVKKVLYFEKGQPVFALSNLLADRFGQFLVRVGKVNQDALQLAAEEAAKSKRRTGDILVERGLLKDTERLYFVGQQVKSIFYSLFGWEDGTYLMTFREKAAKESIKLDVHPANLIIRGIKKLYKPDRLKRLIKPEDRLIPSLQPAYQLHEVELEKWEAELLPSVDGTRTVAELVALTGRPEHVVLGTLAALTALNILERRR